MLVSAVIPTYNYAKYVTEAVHSALSQTYNSIEVIVVDDGSTDDTADRLKPYLSSIRYIHQQNKGLSAARNTGIRAANGEWIALLDSDDIWHPDKTAIQIDAARKFSAACLIGALDWEAEMPERLTRDSAIRKLQVRDFLGTHFVSGSSALIRRRCFDTVGLFDESLRSVEDRDMWLRIAAAFPAVYVDTPCWHYRRHAVQMNRHAQRMYENYCKVLAKFFDAHPEYASLRSFAYARMYQDAAWSHFEEGRRSLAARFLLRSIINHPFSIRDGHTHWYRTKLMSRIVLGEKMFFGLRKLSRPQRANRAERIDERQLGNQYNS